MAYAKKQEFGRGRAWRVHGVIGVSLIAVMLAAPAAAQEGASSTEQGGTKPKADDAKRADDGTIVVTGSRIKRPVDAESSAPITVIGDEQIKQFGTNNLENVLDALPIFQNMDISTASSGFDDTGSGVQRADIRGIGPGRTLHLLNGKRWVTTGFASPNIGDIPTAMIERVEVLRDGASAVYGSDAMSGVINIITKKRFEGLSVGSRFGITGHGDGQEYEASVTGGLSSERGNLLIGLQYQKNMGIYRGTPDRPWSRNCRNNGGGWTYSAGNISCPADSVTARGGPATPGGVFTIVNTGGGYTAGDRYVVVNGAIRPYNAATDTYNWDKEHLRDQITKRSLYAVGNYEITDDINFVFDTLITKRDGFNDGPYDYNAIGVGSFVPNIVIPGSNPYNPFDVDVRMGRFLTEAGPSRSTSTGDMYRVVLGLEGKVKGWDWDVSYNEGKGVVSSALDRIHHNTIPSSKLTGISGIKATLDPVLCLNNTGCTLVNYFGEGKVTQDQVTYLKFKDVRTDVFKEKVFQANITGDLVDLPAGPLALALGVEYRQESGSRSPGPKEKNRPTSGSYDSKEAYIEANIPLVSNATAFDYLGLNLAARYVDNSAFGNDFIFKAGGEWAINKSIRLRGTYSSSFRVPNIQDLFFGQDYGPLFQMGDFYDRDTNPDPCDSIVGQAATDATVAARCAAAGVPTGYTYANTDFFQPGIIGNPELTKESGTTITFGAAITPTAIEGLNITLDYYKIKITDGITAPDFGDFSTTLKDCFVDNNDFRCSLTTRDPFTGLPALINITSYNKAVRVVSGLDFNLSYGFDIGNAGSFTFNSYVTRTFKNKEIPFEGADANDYLGTVGLPKWKGTVSASWRGGPVGLSYIMQWDDGVARFIADPKIERPSVPMQTNHRLQGSYEFKLDNSDVRFTFGVNNLFDKKPPFLLTKVNGDRGTYLTGQYDSLGRSFYLGINADF